MKYKNHMKLHLKSRIFIILILGIFFISLLTNSIDVNYLKNKNNVILNINYKYKRDQEIISDPFKIDSLTNSNEQIALAWSYLTPSNVRSLAISSDGQYSAFGSYDFNVYFFDNNNSIPLQILNVGYYMNSIAMSSDGKYLVTGTSYMGNKLYLFEKNNTTPLWVYDVGDGIICVALSSDGQYIVVGTDRTGRVMLFIKDSPTPLWAYNTGSYVSSVAISSDGNYIVAGNHNNRLFFFQRSSSTPIWTYTTPDWAQNVDITSDGEYLIVGTSNGENPNHKIFLFDKDSSTPLWSYTTGKPIWSVDISSDSHYIVIGTGYTGNTVYLFDRVNSNPLWSFVADDRVSSVAISSDGQYLVAGSYDHKVYFFRRNSSTPIYEYITGGIVAAVGISSDGTCFIAGGMDNTAYFFKMIDKPIIIINIPTLNHLYGIEAPNFNITLISHNPINNRWYTIDGGLTNYTFSGLMGDINQTAWNKINEGILTIRFYVNDSVGQVGFKDVQIIKDSYRPVISIYLPNNENIFENKSPKFIIFIRDENLETSWYTLDNNPEIFPFTEEIVFIDQDAWNEAQIGEITITFYAQDLAGNIGTNSIVVIKMYPDMLNSIPGFNLIFLIGLLFSIMTYIYYKSQKKNQIKIKT